ncbi:MAG: FAD-dependent oxidoreductase, partial [Deltaproteobacteria bacterium]|nr:FAD-dependent oxidoreductase [Deltaproteobacteria bacterium]
MNNQSNKAIVIGAGLAGVEAAWQLAKLGIKVRLFEAKPRWFSPAHKSPNFAELVCSNSLKSEETGHATALLKEEMGKLGSVVIEAAHSMRLPAGKALAVDREGFA